MKSFKHNNLDRKRLPILLSDKKWLDKSFWLNFFPASMWGNLRICLSLILREIDFAKPKI